MRKTKLIAGVGLAAAALLALTACNSGTPGAAPSESAAGGGEETSSTPWTVATDVTIEGSPTFDAMTERGSVKVGVKEDQPGLGYLDPTTGERTGFDIDIARWIAASLGFDEDQIEFQAIPSANREQAIVNGDIDYYVGTYSITDSRKQRVSFAGPYFIAGQDLLVRKDDTRNLSLRPESSPGISRTARHIGLGLARQRIDDPAGDPDREDADRPVDEGDRDRVRLVDAVDHRQDADDAQFDDAQTGRRQRDRGQE